MKQGNLLFGIWLSLSTSPGQFIFPRRVNADITKALGERTCWALGDVIIALEAPPDAEFFTADRHFNVILKTIGKRLFLEETIIVNE